MVQGDDRPAGRTVGETVGTTQKALIESEANGFMEARLQENSIVRVQGDPSMIGRYAAVRITAARSFILSGEIEKLY